MRATPPGGSARLGIRRWARQSRALALGLALALALSGVLRPAAPAWAQGDTASDIAARLAGMRGQFQSRSGGVLGLMGYNVTPDGSANAVQVNRTTATGEQGRNLLTLSQFGFGFTVSESFPLYLETYAGYARYNPRMLFNDGQDPGRSLVRWNNFTGTLGVGYDIRLGEYLWLRPIFNLAGGYAASDLTLLGSFLRNRTGSEIGVLPNAHVNMWGIGGSTVLAYYDYRPARDIDVELRYTQILLQSFGDTVPAARGQSEAKTLSLWGRLRWPTGWEFGGRPVRWVLDGNASAYLGDQRESLGFSWAVKVGGGIELDIGRYEFGGLGLYLSRMRLIARYFYAEDGITGVSTGLGFSF